jgi:hypothetical protein
VSDEWPHSVDANKDWLLAMPFIYDGRTNTFGYVAGLRYSIGANVAWDDELGAVKASVMIDWLTLEAVSELDRQHVYPGTFVSDYSHVVWPARWTFSGPIAAYWLGPLGPSEIARQLAERPLMRRRQGERYRAPGPRAMLRIVGAGRRARPDDSVFDDGVAPLA